MRVGYIQYNPAYLEVEKNLDRVERLLSGADADLLVLPEFFSSGYFFRSRDDVREVAEPIPNGRTVQRIAGWSAGLGATIVAGLPEVEEGHFYNSAVMVTPDGRVERYRKVHLYYEEKLYFTPGERFDVFDVQDREGNDYRLGVMVCFDWHFPESARTLSLLGADIIAHPSNLVRKTCPGAMPIRALENHVFSITANRTGAESNGSETLTFIGQSLICGPDGEVLRQADQTETALHMVSIDPTRARHKQLTSYNDLFGDRMPGAYGGVNSSP